MGRFRLSCGFFRVVRHAAQDLGAGEEAGGDKARVASQPRYSALTSERRHDDRLYTARPHRGQNRSSSPIRSPHPAHTGPSALPHFEQ